ncbi:MAG: radical SAM protein [Elusimicrobia bacterium]|nr:radical SAM protein [Elusimicrobiota bacterium]
MGPPPEALFITAPYRCWGVQVVGSWPPLHLAYLAGAARRAGVTPRILDAMNLGHGHAEIKAEIAAARPAWVISYDYLPVTGAVSTAAVPDAIAILRSAKEVDPRIKTVLGGPHPTFMPQEVLESAAGAVDYILLGEGEETLSQLMMAERTGSVEEVAGIAFLKDGKAVLRPLRAQMSDLESIPPAWDILDWDLYKYLVAPGGRMASVLTSRGCEMSCSFCSQRLFWQGTWRARKPELVVAELSALSREHGIKVFTLIDAYPTRDRTRWEELLDRITSARLDALLLMETRVEDILRDRDILDRYRKAGIVHVYMGAESGDDDVLRRLGKELEARSTKEAVALLRDAGIVSETSFMIGFPHETWDSIERTIASAIDMDPDIAVFPIVTPWPYTPLYAEMRDRIRVFDHSKYNLVTPIVEPYAMSLEEVSRAMGKCYMDFYFHKMKQVLADPPGFKRDYLNSAFRLMMKDLASGIAGIKMGGTMPEAVRKRLGLLRSASSRT